MTVEAIEATGRGSRVKRARPAEARLRRGREAVIKAVLFLCAFISVVTTLAIIFMLLRETVAFFRQVSVIEFLTGTKWTPLFTPSHFGVLPLLCGTLLVAIGGALVALPAGLLTAIFLSEYASPRLRSIVKPVLEVLAGIPTVVFGFFALTFISPEIIQRLFPGTQVFNAASAAIVVGIMIIPLVSSLSEDAMSAVPRACVKGHTASAATDSRCPSRWLFRRRCPASSPHSSSPSPAPSARR